MSKRKVASGISKVINKLHGIDKQEPLVEGVDYTVPKEGEGVQLSQEFIDSMRQRSLELLAQSEAMKEVTSTPIMSSVLKPNPKRAQAQQQSQQAPAEEKKDDAPEKDPNFTKIGPGVVQPLKVNDSEADILGKMFNFMKMEYDWESKQHKKDKKYHKALDEQKERFLDETIEALTGKKPKGTKKSGKSSKKSSLLKTALKGAAGVGMFLLAEKALANVDWKSIVPDFDLGTGGGVGAGVGAMGGAGAGDWKKDTEFMNEINRYSKEKGIKASDLLSVMAYESGIDPSKVNKKSGATGLIQFMPKTAKDLGTTTEELGKMSRVQQMKYVEKYFDLPGNKLKPGSSAGEIYSKVFLPARSGSEILTKRGEDYYESNKGLDVGNKGYITKSDLQQLAEVKKKQFQIEDVQTPIETAVQTIPETKDTTIPQKLKSPKGAGGTTLGVVNNNTNIINPAPTYTVSQDFVPHYPALIQQQYQLNS